LARLGRLGKRRWYWLRRRWLRYELTPTKPPSTPQQVPPKTGTPDNVCEFAGNAPDPSFWAAAGKASRWDPVSAVLDLTKGFKIGGYLDAQPMATGNPYQRAAYGNYAFGVWMRASGTPLPIALVGANEVAFRPQSLESQPASRPTDG
jgi:hypothetical protein